MIDINQLTQLISAFRIETEKESISPETVGSLLQRIADLLNTAATAADLEVLKSWRETLGAIGSVVTTISQGTADAENLNLTLTKSNLQTGTVSTAVDAVSILPATAQRAGVMTARQFASLSDAASTAASLDTAMTSVQNRIEALSQKLSSTQLSLSNLKASVDKMATNRSSCGHLGHIAITIHKGVEALYIENAVRFTANGYVPILFRYCAKRNRVSYINDDGITKHAHSSVKKGWCPVGKYNACRMNPDNKLQLQIDTKFFDNEHLASTEEFSASPEFFVHSVMEDGHYNTCSFGKRKIAIYVEDSSRPSGYRYHQISLQYGVAFCKKITDDRTGVEVTELVTNIAPFHLTFQPVVNEETQAYSGHWVFTK